MYFYFFTGQWENEINRRTEHNTLPIALFHGQDRHKLNATLHKYDVVITTYHVIFVDPLKIALKTL